MAEELTDEQKAEQVQAYIRAEAKAEVERLIAERENKEKASKKAVESEEDVFRKAINPYIKEETDRALLEARDAKDIAMFYRRNPGAVEYEEKIEETFVKSVENGRPTNRDTIYRYLVGEKVLKNPEDYVKEITEKQKKDVKNAEDAQDFGLLSISKVKSDPRFANFRDKTREEMEIALDGVEF